MRGLRGWPREDPRSPLATSYEAAAKGIEDQFRRQLDGLRRRFREWEIPAVLRALQEERRHALRLLQERRAGELFSERQERKRRRPPPQLHL